jgi:hypothetical protein
MRPVIPYRPLSPAVVMVIHRAVVEVEVEEDLLLHVPYRGEEAEVVEACWILR